MKVFISHSSYDKWVARQISKELTARGHQTFLDEKDIKTGDSIDSSIQLHLKDSDDLLVVISPVSLKSHWVFIEIGGAKALGKRIIPILFHVQPNEIPQAIASLLAKDLNDIDRYYLELEERNKPLAKAATLPKPRPSKAKVTSVEGFSIGDPITVIDVGLLTKEDKLESPKWVSEMDKFSGATGKIIRFAAGRFPILDIDKGQYAWNTKWLRKG